MRVLTPMIAWHSGEPVLSVDVHPSGRLATGGSDSNVRIWRLPASYFNGLTSGEVPAELAGEERGNLSSSSLAGQLLTPKEMDFLSDLRAHEKGVNIVRFSPNGNWLASASDDGYIMIWELDTTASPSSSGSPAAAPAAPSASSSSSSAAAPSSLVPSASASAVSPEDAEQSAPMESEADFGNDEEPVEQKEVWVCRQRLRAHSADIYDLSWSADSMGFISGAVDRSAFVWRWDPANKRFSVAQRLSRDSGYVQGVTWDPLGQYLATLSSGKCCNLFQIRAVKQRHQLPSDVKAALEQLQPELPAVTSDSLEPLASTASLPYDPVESLASYAVEFFSSGMVKARTTTSLEASGSGASIPEEEEEELEEPSFFLQNEDEVEGSEDEGVAGASGAASVAKSHVMFHDDSLPSFFRRLSFSPDGQLLVLPAGVFKPLAGDLPDSSPPASVAPAAAAPAAGASAAAPEGEEAPSQLSNSVYIFHRSNLRQPFMHLPCGEPSTCVRFSPVLYQRRLPGNASPLMPWFSQYRMVFAVATTSAVRIYDTESPYPFVVVSNIHFSGITDLAWTPDGRTLCITSSDGYCSFVALTEKDLGSAELPEQSLRLLRAWLLQSRSKILRKVLVRKAKRRRSSDASARTPKTPGARAKASGASTPSSSAASSSSASGAEAAAAAGGALDSAPSTPNHDPSSNSARFSDGQIIDGIMNFFAKEGRSPTLKLIMANWKCGDRRALQCREQSEALWKAKGRTLGVASKKSTKGAVSPAARKLFGDAAVPPEKTARAAPRPQVSDEEALAKLLEFYEKEAYRPSLGEVSALVGLGTVRAKRCREAADASWAASGRPPLPTKRGGTPGPASGRKRKAPASDTKGAEDEAAGEEEEEEEEDGEEKMEVEEEGEDEPSEDDEEHKEAELLRPQALAVSLAVASMGKPDSGGPDSRRRRVSPMLVNASPSSPSPSRPLNHEAPGSASLLTPVREASAQDEEETPRRKRRVVAPTLLASAERLE